MVSWRLSDSDISTKLGVALSVLDRLRAEKVNRGGLLNRLPTVRQLFQESSVFTRAYALAHWTLPFHVSQFTRLSPIDYLAHLPYMKLREDMKTMAKISQKEGHLAECVTYNAFLSDVSGMTGRFEVVWRSRRHSRPIISALNIVSDFILRHPRQNGRIFRTLVNLAQAAFDIFRSSPIWDKGTRDAMHYVRSSVRVNSQPIFLLVDLSETHEPYYARGTFSESQKRVRHADIFTSWFDIWHAVLGGIAGMHARQRENEGRNRPTNGFRPSQRKAERVQGREAKEESQIRGPPMMAIQNHPPEKRAFLAEELR